MKLGVLGLSMDVGGDIPPRLDLWWV